MSGNAPAAAVNQSIKTFFESDKKTLNEKVDSKKRHPLKPLFIRSKFREQVALVYN